MTKILMLLAGMLALGTAQAQLTKGRVLLGGTVAFTDSRSSNHYATQQLGLTAGIFPTDNLLVAATGSYSNAPGSYSIDNVNISVSKSYSLGLLLRRYYPLGKQFYLTLEGSAVYDHNSGYWQSGTYVLPQRSNGFTVAAGPGISYSFGRRLLLDLNLGQLLSVTSYRQIAQDATGVEKVRSTQTSAGFGRTGTIPFNIGFNFLLGR
ncbi:hypothetical protein [Flaviaesturariibacter terrae]